METRTTGRSPVLPWVSAALFTLLAALALLWLDGIERQRGEEAERNRILTQLDSIRSRLEASLNAPLLRTRGMAAHIVAQGDITREHFDTIARYLLRGHHNVRNMVLSRGMVIAMSYPLAGNESIIGVDYHSIPEQYTMVRKAIDTRAPVLQGPVPLIQGGLGLIARFPVFLKAADGGPDGPFFGMVNIVLDIPAVLAEAGLERNDLGITVAIRGRDGLGAAGAVIHGSEAVFNQRPAELDVALPLGSWRLAAIPEGGWDAAVNPFGRTRVLAGLIFLLVAATAFGAAKTITDRDATERALRAKTLELERSNADLERFAYVASHDLQTPLRNIASYTQLLDRRYRGRLDADADTFIGYIVDGCKRMSQMITDLLDYARISTPDTPLQPVSSRWALSQAQTNLAEDIDGSATHISVGELPVVLAHATQLISLFQNLLSNAIKYHRPDRSPSIAISAKTIAPGMARFAVADNGIGIDPEYFERIFEFFQRLHPPGAGAGSGVGLAVCRRIVRYSGGDIWVESEPGHGTTFFFTLRLAAGEHPPESLPTSLPTSLPS